VQLGRNLPGNNSLRQKQAQPYEEGSKFLLSARRSCLAAARKRDSIFQRKFTDGVQAGEAKYVALVAAARVGYVF